MGMDVWMDGCIGEKRVNNRVWYYTNCRHPLESWNIFSADKEGLLYLLLNYPSSTLVHALDNGPTKSPVILVENQWFSLP